MKKGRQQEKFLRLYEPIHDRFERFCRARVYGDMEFRDLMNETLLVAFEKFDTLKSKDAFLSFLFSGSVVKPFPEDIQPIKTRTTTTCTGFFIHTNKCS